MDDLPSETELASLPSRSLVAYTLRAAQRVIRELGHDDLAPDVLEVAQEFVQGEQLGDDRIVELLFRAAELSEAARSARASPSVSSRLHFEISYGVSTVR